MCHGLWQFGLHLDSIEVLVQTSAFASRFGMSTPPGIFGAPIMLLTFDGFGLVLVHFSRRDFHPF